MKHTGYIEIGEFVMEYKMVCGASFGVSRRFSYVDTIYINVYLLLKKTPFEMFKEVKT